VAGLLRLLGATRKESQVQLASFGGLPAGIERLHVDAAYSFIMSKREQVPEQQGAAGHRHAEPLALVLAEILDRRIDPAVRGDDLLPPCR
jgi:hypothetical protein